MNKNLLKLTAVIALSSSMFGCAAAVVGGVAAGATTGVAVAEDPRSSSGVFDDQGLRSKVSDAVTATVPGNIEVTSYNARILLSGQVSNAEGKSKAEAMAKQVPGVKSVYNYLEVGKNQSATQSSKDAYITSAVKSKLLFTKNVDSNDVKVVTTNGVVYLLGMVDEYQANKMTEAARQVSDVKRVVPLFQ
ncbi:MAG: BON domain-containing protein [Burkholderiales bacterium]|nr:BON domain-containing protein [Burkholderiales bacterium]